MTDVSINPYDIFIRQPRKYTLFSTFINNIWAFDDYKFFELKIKDNQASYYRITVPFAVLEAKQEDPSKYSFTGNTGDYLCVDSNENFTILTKDKFLINYPQFKQ